MWRVRYWAFRHRNCCFCPQRGGTRVVMELSTLGDGGTEQGVSALPEGPGEVSPTKQVTCNLRLSTCGEKVKEGIRALQAVGIACAKT